MKSVHYFIGVICAGLAVAITLFSAATQTLLNTHAMVVMILVATLIASLILLRAKSGVAFGALGLAVGALVSLGLAQEMQHRQQRDSPAPAAYTVAQTDAMRLDQHTRFEVVLVFPEATSSLALEQFIHLTLKRVHVQACVHKLPCLARLLRLSQLGAARAEVIAFDLMGDTPQFERVALISAAQHHPLKPALFYSTSALAATQTNSL